MAYVVRTTDAELGDRYKVFRKLPDARGLFCSANSLVTSGVRDAAYLYEVPGEDDARAAVVAVKTGNAIILDRSPTNDEWLKLADELGI
jgi:hypothetical protein